MQWFEPATVGLEVADLNNGMRVAKVKKGSPSAKAGTRAGDVITAVDGKKIESADSFRRLLRRGSVMDFCKLTLQRDGKELVVVLEFLEDGLPAKR